MVPVTIPTLVRAQLTHAHLQIGRTLCQDESKDIAVLVDFSSTMYTASTQPATISKGNNQAATACDDDDDEEDVQLLLYDANLHMVAHRA